MSRETLQWLNTNTLIGQTDKRGTAWHYRAEEQEGLEPNHYPGFIPVEDVQRRLFYWEAKSRPVFTTVPCKLEDADGIDDDGQPYKLFLVESEQRIVRIDPDLDLTKVAVYGNFKSGYTIHGYQKWLLDNVATILDDDLGITSAGLLKKGAVAWVEVSIPDTIESPTGIQFRPNLLASTSMDGSSATQYGRKINCVVCDNTLSGALNEKDQKIKFKHSRYSELKAGQAREALQMVYSLADDYLAQLQALDSIKVPEKKFLEMVDRWVLEGATPAGKPTLTWTDLKTKGGRSLTMASNKRDALTRLYRNDTRVAPWAGTGIGVIQAFNTYVHHEGIVRGADRAERNMQSAVEGKFDTLDQEIFDLMQSVLAR